MVLTAQVSAVMSQSKVADASDGSLAGAPVRCISQPVFGKEHCGGPIDGAWFVVEQPGQ